MRHSFKAAMTKLSLLGQSYHPLIDCSEVIPVPKPFKGQAHLPAGSTLNDIEASVGVKILIL